MNLSVSQKWWLCLIGSLLGIALLVSAMFRIGPWADLDVGWLLFIGWLGFAFAMLCIWKANKLKPRPEQE